MTNFTSKSKSSWFYLGSKVKNLLRVTYGFNYGDQKFDVKLIVSMSTTKSHPYTLLLMKSEGSYHPMNRNLTIRMEGMF